jgi:hypothetical protein
MPRHKERLAVENQAWARGTLYVANLQDKNKYILEETAGVIKSMQFIMVLQLVFFMTDINGK